MKEKKKTLTIHILSFYIMCYVSPFQKPFLTHESKKFELFLLIPIFMVILSKLIWGNKFLGILKETREQKIQFLIGTYFAWTTLEVAMLTTCEKNTF